MPAIGTDLRRPRGVAGSAVFAILTITPAELAEAKAVLNLNVLVPTAATPYYVGRAEEDGNYKIVLCRSLDRTNVPAHETVTELIFQFSPQFLLVIGTAGGVDGQDNVALGDIVVGDFLEYSEFRKFHGGQNRKRSVAHDHPSLYLRQHAEAVAISGDWRVYIQRERPVAGEVKVLSGNILSCEKIWGDYANPQQVELLSQFDKAMAIETEAYGAARAIYGARHSVHYNPQLLVVRGISDMVGAPANNEQRAAWTTYAACAVSAFARALTDRVLPFHESQAPSTPTTLSKIRRLIRESLGRLLGSYLA